MSFIYSIISLFPLCVDFEDGETKGPTRIYEAFTFMRLCVVAELCLRRPGIEERANDVGFRMQDYLVPGEVAHLCTVLVAILLYEVIECDLVCEIEW